MEHIEKSIEVNAPIRAVYDQWTQFETFPQFMEGVHEVKQIDDTHLHWRAKVGGKEEEWTAEITQQVPDQVVAWRSTSGAENDGRVSFDKRGPDKTHITLHIDYDPQNWLESIGDKLGFMSRELEGDLKRFKTFIEERGAPTGAWRGEVHVGRRDRTYSS